MIKKTLLLTLATIFAWIFIFTKAHPLVSGILSFDSCRFFFGQADKGFVLLTILYICIYILFCFFLVYTIKSISYQASIYIGFLGLICLLFVLFPQIGYKDIGKSLLVRQDTIGVAMHPASSVINISSPVAIKAGTKVNIRYYEHGTDGDIRYRFKPILCTEDNYCFIPWGTGEPEYYMENSDPRRWFIRLF